MHAQSQVGVHPGARAGGARHADSHLVPVSRWVPPQLVQPGGAQLAYQGGRIQATVRGGSAAGRMMYPDGNRDRSYVGDADLVGRSPGDMLC